MARKPKNENIYKNFSVKKFFLIITLIMKNIIEKKTKISSRMTYQGRLRS